MSDSWRTLGLCSPWNSPGQNNGMGSCSLLQGIFPTQGSNPGLPHCRQILYQLSHKGSPGILEWVAYPFSSGYSWPRNQTHVSCILYQLSQGSTGGPYIISRIKNWIYNLRKRLENIFSFKTENKTLSTLCVPLPPPYLKKNLGMNCS